MSETDNQSARVIKLTADIASAYVGNNSVALSDLTNLIKGIFGALTGVDTSPEKPVESLTPAVSIKKSITQDYLICLEDGRQLKSMKRHLRTKYNLSPEGYRTKWGLPKDYPMVAPAYAAARSSLAKQMGLGQGGRSAAIAGAVSTPRARPAPRPRKSKV